MGTPPPIPSWPIALSPTQLPTSIPSPPLGFTSSFSSFNLPSPRHHSPSFAPPNPVDFNFSTQRSPTLPPTSTSFSFTSNRKPSMLTQELLPPISRSPPEESADPEDDSMILGSPVMGYQMPLSGRSRSASDAMGSVPASPVTVARALGTQRTPPPFLQRKLFSGMQEDESGSSGSDGGRREDEEDGIDGGGMGLGLVGKGSGSGSEEGVGTEVVRRPVARKPNLLPKPKSHLRVLSQLRTEDGPADQLEIASEATLHRLSRSASVLPILRPPPTSTSAAERPTSSHGASLSTSRPTPNRFPEAAEEELVEEGSASSGEEVEEGSDWGAMSLGYGTEEEDERKASIWTGIRGGGIGIGGANGKSPGSERRMDVEGALPTLQNSPSTPGWHTGARPGKRKMAEDRFEPYAQAFKRRAVSPAASALGSPILSFSSSGSSPFPPPLPFSPSTTSFPPSTTFPTFPTTYPSPLNPPLTLPIPIPSPPVGPHHTFFSQGPGRSSRAGSPASVGSSTGRGWWKEREEGSGKMGETGDGLGRMSLG